MNHRRNAARKLPLWVKYGLDFLLFAAMLLIFCYFHHVRILWGIGTDGGGIDTIDPGDSGFAGNPSQPGHTVHDWSVKTVIPPTCTVDGYTIYSCRECEAEKRGDWTAAAGHSRADPVGVREATEFESGYTGDVYCTVCSALLLPGQEIPATTHKNTRRVNVRAATCTEPGYTGDIYCDDCHRIVAQGTETLLLAHAYETVEIVAPMCSAEGYTLKRCAKCGATEKTNFQAMTMHAIGDDGNCVYCGKTILDTSGDFGASFPEKFLQNAERISLSDSAAILSYATANGIVLKQSPDTKYIALYRSHDIFMTVTETNTRLYYAGTGKTYTVQYYVYDIYVRNLSNLSTSYSTSQRKPMADLIQATEQSSGEVVAAVNGDYMGNANYCRVCVRNGKVIRKTDDVSGDVCVLNYDGTMKTYKRNEYSWEEIEAGRPYQVWNFGPALIDGEGKAIRNYASLDDYVVNNRHPRTGIGYYEPGHYAFIAVDGRSDDSEGVRIVQLADLFVALGCRVAYNMDGGDSAQAWVGDTVIRESQSRGDDQRDLWDIICVSENS